ncbi:MAG TPA: response regulator [Chloroflexia bacterium]|nr:response regulator [Chloroflexia bacterium]
MAHILVVDDSELALEVVKMMLESEGHQVTVTADSREFVKLAESANPLPDLLMMDSVMPEISGPELIQLIRQHPNEHLAGLPILLMSALESELEPSDGVLLLTKPFTPDELSQALEFVLG